MINEVFVIFLLLYGLGLCVLNLTADKKKCVELENVSHLEQIVVVFSSMLFGAWLLSLIVSIYALISTNRKYLSIRTTNNLSIVNGYVLSNLYIFAGSFLLAVVYQYYTLIVSV